MSSKVPGRRVGMMIDRPLRDLDRPIDPTVLYRLQRGSYDRKERPTTWLADHHPDEFEHLSPAVSERLRALAERLRTSH